MGTMSKLGQDVNSILTPNEYKRAVWAKLYGNRRAKRIGKSQLRLDKKAATKYGTRPPQPPIIQIEG